MIGSIGHLVDLWEDFNRIWSFLAESGQCDALNSAEYRRVILLWTEQNFPSPIGDFIEKHANPPCTPFVEVK